MARARPGHCRRLAAGQDRKQLNKKDTGSELKNAMEGLHLVIIIIIIIILPPYFQTSYLRGLLLHFTMFTWKKGKKSFKLVNHLLQKETKL